jgi:hypothetical protein
MSASERSMSSTRRTQARPNSVNNMPVAAGVVEAAEAAGAAEAALGVAEAEVAEAAADAGAACHGDPAASASDFGRLSKREPRSAGFSLPPEAG